MNHPEIIIVPAFFGTVAYIVWTLVVSAQRRHRLKLMTEFHSRLLDRLGSVKDFGEFLQTPAGSRFMADLASEPMTSGPQERILRASQLGIVLGCLGLGLLATSFFWSPYASEEGQTAFGAFGAIALFLGIGFAASAVASYRLASMLGLLQRKTEGSADTLVSRA